MSGSSVPEGLTERELARRAGVSEGDVRRLVEAGILLPGDGSAPFAAGDVKRVRMARACEEAGLPVEAMGRAIAAGKLSFAFLDLPTFRWAARSDTTYRELAAEGGVPVDLVLAMHEAMGFTAPDPDDRIREDDREVLPLLQVAVALGLEESTLLRTMRVYGQSLRRITDAETSVYHHHIEMPMLRSGMTEREMIERATATGSQFVPLMDRALMAVYRRQQEHSWTQDLVEHVEDALAEAGLHRRVERPPAMCFLDLTGYTKLTEERGDEAAADLAGRLASMVQHVSQGHGGRPVKWLGDGVMFHFPEPGGGVVAALEMAGRTTDAGLPPAHVGLDAGPVVFQDGDYFGKTVNLAARIAAHAHPGQVLVSDSVVETSASNGVRFREIGPVELKGISGAVRLHEALAGD